MSSGCADGFATLYGFRKGNTFVADKVSRFARHLENSFGPRLFVLPVLSPDYGVDEVFHIQIVHHHTD